MRRLVLASGGFSLAFFLTVMHFQNQSVLQAQAPARRIEIIAQDARILIKDEAILASERAGIIEFVLPEEGDAVEANQELARLKDGVARATLAKEEERARNDVQIRFARKSSEVADKELEISTTANARVQGAVPQVEIQKLELASQKGKLQIEQAAFEQKIAELTVTENLEALKTHQVIAPFAGTVSKVHRKPGEAVRQGDPILEILSTSRVKVEGFVSAAESYRISPGDPVEAELKLSLTEVREAAGTFPGIVKFVEPRVDVGGRVKVTAEVQNPRGILKAGLEARMRIIPGGARQARTLENRLR